MNSRISSTKRGVALALIIALVLALVVGGIAAIFGGGSSSDQSRPTTGPTASTSTTTPIEFSGVGSEAYCETSERLNQELIAGTPTSSDPAALEVFFGQTVAVFRELELIAPVEIKADIATTVGAYEIFEPFLVAAQWDQSQVPEAAIAAIETPEIIQAGQRLQAYEAQFCNLAPQP